MKSGRIAALVVGAGLVAIVLAGRATLLVRPWFAPVLLAAGALIAVAASRYGAQLSRPGAIALLAPVVVGLTLTPAVVGRVSTGPADLATLTHRIGDLANPLVAGRGGSVTLLQILFAEQQLGGVALSGRSVTVDAIASGAHTLSRSVIVCCAADAQSISISETGIALPGGHAWVRVSGRLQSEGTRTVLAATSATRIPTPANPFL
jgi:hypothetical protein